MKKLLIFTLALLMLAVACFGCSKTPDYFKGQWNFAKISKVEVASHVSETTLDELMQAYDAESKAAVEEKALAAFLADGTFSSCYLKFGTELSYTYDPLMEREATWVFYQTGENEGFISFYAELDVADGNPDPTNNPAIIYNAETDTLYMTINYISFMVTIELSR